MPWPRGKPGPRKDLRGREYGLWLVLGDAPDVWESNSHRGPEQVRRVRVLRCRCLGCRREFDVRHYALTRGRSQGCSDCRPGGKPSREEDWFTALDLYREGYTYREIGLKLGVGASRARQMAEKARAYLRRKRRSEDRSDRGILDGAQEGSSTGGRRPAQ